MSFFSPGMEAADLVLLNTFGETHTIQDIQVLAAIDEDEYRERREKLRSEPVEGVFAAGIVVYVKLAGLGFRPEVGELLTVDDVEYIVLDCEQGEKLLILTLQENHS